MTLRPRHGPGRAAGALGLVLLAACPSAAHAFKMGEGDEFEDVEKAAAGLPARDAWVYREIRRKRFSFGEPTHERMTAASVALASRLPAAQVCEAPSEKIVALTRRIPDALLGNSVCCAKTAVSEWCKRAESVRYDPFQDPNQPLITGSRWNDDACHMSYRNPTLIGWAAWMLDSEFRRSGNLNYSSHYHEKQFLHAMASSGFGRPDSEREVASVTTHKIMTWAEFAFRVAEGSIAPDMPLDEVVTRLPQSRHRAFRLAFAGHGKMKVGVLFAGTEDFAPEHVRQIALGALLHTVQDAFSASHVERINDTSPTLKGRGKVVRFLNYRLQDAALHGAQDRRPTDATDAAAGDFHPVSLGARLIGCAAGGTAEASNWPGQAQAVMLSLLARARDKPDPPASGGRYAADPMAQIYQR